MEKKKFKIAKNKNINYQKKVIGKLYIRIFVSINNTIITIVDGFSKSLFWVTSCTTGLKGAKKSTSYSSQLAGEIAAKFIIKHGLKEVDLLIKGLGPGRDATIRGVFNSGIKIASISDLTPIPHNGCKPRKRKRN